MIRMSCLLALLATQAAPLLGQFDAASQNGIVLRPGDAVRITVWRQPELSGEFAIAADGSVGHPLYRSVVVTGAPLDEVERRIEAFLREFEQNPAFLIQPLFRVDVGGEVRSPNLYTFPPEVTLADAVALAGGPSEEGRSDRVSLIRAGAVTTFDLTDPDSEANRVRLRSGDQVRVERRGGSFFRGFVVPASSIVGAVVAVVNLFR